MSAQKQGDSMKKILSFALAVALLVQSSGMQAFPQWQGSRAQQLKQQMGSGISSVLSKYIGQPGSEQAKKFMAWFGPFSSELKKAFKKGNYASMPGIVNKYRAQAAGSAIAVAVVIVITAVVAALVGRAVMGTGAVKQDLVDSYMNKYKLDSRLDPFIRLALENKGTDLATRLERFPTKEIFTVEFAEVLHTIGKQLKNKATMDAAGILSTRYSI